MGYLTLFSNTEKKQQVKTSDIFEFEVRESNKGTSKRRRTRDEIHAICKEIGQDLFGQKYVGHSFQSSLD